jgi:hypothetical protein
MIYGCAERPSRWSAGGGGADDQPRAHLDGGPIRSVRLLTQGSRRARDVGDYAQSNDAFLRNVALNVASFGIDLIGH